MVIFNRFCRLFKCTSYEIYLRLISFDTTKDGDLTFVEPGTVMIRDISQEIDIL